MLAISLEASSLFCYEMCPRTRVGRFLYRKRKTFFIRTTGFRFNVLCSKLISSTICWLLSPDPCSVEWLLRRAVINSMHACASVCVHSVTCVHWHTLMFVRRSSIICVWYVHARSFPTVLSMFDVIFCTLTCSSHTYTVHMHAHAHKYVHTYVPTYTREWTRT